MVKGAVRYFCRDGLRVVQLTTESCWGQQSNPCKHGKRTINDDDDDDWRDVGGIRSGRAG